MVAKLPNSGKTKKQRDREKEENFAKYKCPKDCPFLGGTKWEPMCEYALRADDIGLLRNTRTTVNLDGSLDFHIPPDCDIYDEYKDRVADWRKLKNNKIFAINRELKRHK